MAFTWEYAIGALYIMNAPRHARVEAAIELWALRDQIRRELVARNELLQAGTKWQ